MLLKKPGDVPARLAWQSTNSNANVTRLAGTEIDMMFGTGFKRSQVQTGVQWARARGKVNGGL